MTQSPKPSADHARHDRLVVVRYLDLDDDLLASEVTEARALLAGCPDCAALASELQLITDATSSMALPTRPRDFRLTPQQAASLRPGGLRRILENAGAAFRFEFLRPLAGATVAIGLLLAVVGALPQINPASPAGFSVVAATSERAGGVPAPTAGPAALAAATDAAGLDVQPSAEAVVASFAPQVAPQTPGAPMAAATVKAAATAPFATDTETHPRSMPVASDAAVGTTSDTTTAFGPRGSPESAQAPPAQSNSGGAVTAGPEQRSNSISPLLILGLLLASVGLLVILLTFVARRIGRSAG